MALQIGFPEILVEKFSGPDFAIDPVNKVTITPNDFDSADESDFELTLGSTIQEWVVAKLVNSVDTVATRLPAILSQALKGEGATTIPKGSTSKRMEAPATQIG